MLWLIMINPFRVLAEQARVINAQSNPDEVKVRGVQEAVEIAEAVEGMLARIGDEQQRTRAALESARDFAAVASHELRTPLTAMRTNLEVLSTLDLPDEQRKEVIADVMRTQSRIEATLSALERLAQGELTTVDDFVPVDITELLDRAAHDAMRNYPDLEVSLASPTTVLMVGMPAGLRLVIDNAITNAVKHGGATEIRLAAISSVDGVEITVDDNGLGVPEEERAAVFDRFSRGSTAARSGSGLGLALVAQQAEIHGGTAAPGDESHGWRPAAAAAAAAELAARVLRVELVEQPLHRARTSGRSSSRPPVPTTGARCRRRGRPHRPSDRGPAWSGRSAWPGRRPGRADGSGSPGRRDR